MTTEERLARIQAKHKRFSEGQYGLAFGITEHELPWLLELADKQATDIGWHEKTTVALLKHELELQERVLELEAPKSHLCPNCDCISTVKGHV